MVDFRYHLISLVAVFLALGLGILIGSAALGQDVPKRIEANIDDVRERNNQLQQEVTELDRRIQSDESFAQAVEPYLLDGELAQREVVVFEIEGSDGDILDSVRIAVERADASITSSVRVTPAFDLRDERRRAALGRIIGGGGSTAEELLGEAGSRIGSRIAAAAAPGSSVAADRRASRLLDRLERAGFLSTELADDQVTVPAGAMFVVTGGGREARPWETPPFTAALSEALAGRGAAVVAVQPADSAWGPCSAVRADSDASAVVSTVDQGNVVAGRVALVQALELASEGEIGHYGTGPGASGGQIPEAPPGE